MTALADLPTAFAVARWYPTGSLDVNPQWDEFVEAVERVSPGWFLAGDPSLCPCRLLEARPVPSAADVAMQLSCWVALGLLGSQQDRPLGQVLVEAGVDTWTLRLRLLHDRNRAPRIVGTLVTLRTEDAKEIGPVHPIERVTAAFLRWSSRRYKRERLKPEDLGIGVPDEEEAELEGARPRRMHRPDRPRPAKPVGEGARHARPGGHPQHTAPDAAPGAADDDDAEPATADLVGADGAPAAADDEQAWDAPEYAASQVADASEARDEPTSSATEPDFRLAVPEPAPAGRSDPERDDLPAAGEGTQAPTATEYAAPEIAGAARDHDEQLRPAAGHDAAAARWAPEGNGADAAGTAPSDAGGAQPSAGSGTEVGGDSGVPNASTSEASHADRPPGGVPEASTSGTTT